MWQGTWQRGHCVIARSCRLLERAGAMREETDDEEVCDEAVADDD